jgi:D-ribose pyranose/furanose isomerase RbsD
MNNIKIIEHGNSVHQKHEQIRQEMLVDESLLAKELRDGLIKLKEEFDQQKMLMINTLMIINIEKSLVTMKDICQFTETKSSIGYNVR